MSEIPSSYVYPWQQSVWESLTQRFPQLGHGLLFYGKKGCGKQAFAQHFLTWVLCLNKQKQGACGVCSSCLWLKSDTHPNYVYISTDEDNKKQNAKIKIEKIRDLQPFVQQTVEGWRVIMIEPAEALNIASSNALLKTLEEPGERTLIILLADHYLKLPATIRSRLQHFAMDRISDEQAEVYLKQHLAAEQVSHIPLLMNLANDMPLQAVELAESEWLKRRAEFIVDWQKLVINKNMPMLYATKWNKELSFNDFIHMLEYLLCDLICVKLNQPIKNIDLQLETLVEQYSLEVLFNINEELQAFKKQVEQNVQSNLIIDQIFIQLMNV
ncbi:DNA polymerase III subunit delta' C-terminal domain-containing protein [Acinetobacter shaoyimingii]|uniref:DNA polymerase III subunit delta' n=1 Tax=Acinetobacter shaoyimingii TaxID=2715164 RepID=A0A6G8RWF9_9GAMM|nr:DNA polymerase III subunit delta' C-terminal domain-containing protein [Acinetobacter shaoyimingii]NHB57211.1 DNA polymerase III subunit delta' [Acinetobacter shaoyimingii]QIO06180.1 DNA polymerase III subunit delta' [Acinetobacter shaoyimingii]